MGHLPRDVRLRPRSCSHRRAKRFHFVTHTVAVSFPPLAAGRAKLDLSRAITRDVVSRCFVGTKEGYGAWKLHLKLFLKFDSPGDDGVGERGMSSSGRSLALVDGGVAVVSTRKFLVSI